jgi:hypothetical protein
VLTRCQAVAALTRRRFRFKHPLRTLDTTLIELCATVFDWARFVRMKGAITLHLQLDHQGCLPCWALVTAGDVNDVRVSQQLTFAPGTIVAMDPATWTMRCTAGPRPRCGLSPAHGPICCMRCWPGASCPAGVPCSPMR